MIVWDEDRNRNKWKLGIVSELIEGKDNIILERKYEQQTRASNSTPVSTRAVLRQAKVETQSECTPRSQRDAVATAKVRLQQQAEVEDQ